MLARLNHQLEKMMPLITPVGVLTGVWLGSYLSGYAYLSPWVFAFMTFAGSINSSFGDFFSVLKRPAALITCLLTLHVLMPLVAMGMGHVFFDGDALTITGFILAAAIPTGISSFVWVGIYRGNTALTLAIILLDTLLSPVVVPYTLSVLVGARVSLDIGAMMQSLFLMVVFPSVLGMFINHRSKGRVKQRWGPRLSPFSKLSMGIVVAINGSVIAPYLRDINLRLVQIALVVLAVASLGYILGFLVARSIGWGRDNVVALTLNGGMRNISAGSVLAITYFPAPVAIPVVLGMLFQQSLAALFGYLLGRFYSHREGEGRLAVAARERQMRHV